MDWMLNHRLYRPAQETIHWVSGRLPTVANKSITQAGSFVIQDQHRIDGVGQATVLAVTIRPFYAPLAYVFAE